MAGSLQLQPRGGPGTYFYSPSRDIAHNTPFYIGRAIYCLEEVHREDWFADYLADKGVTDDDLAKVAVACAEYVKITERDLAIDNPHDALKKAGFFDLSEPCRIILMAKLGQLFLTGFFLGRRESMSALYDQPFSTPAVQAVVDAAAECVAKFGKLPWWESIWRRARQILSSAKGLFTWKSQQNPPTSSEA